MSPRAGSRGSRNTSVAELFLIILLATSLLPGLVSLYTPIPALAADAGEDGYVGELLEGTPEWDEGIIENIDGYSGGDNSDSIIDNISNLLHVVASMALGFGIVLAVAKFVGRAVIEILDVPPPAIPTFFRTKYEMHRDPKDGAGIFMGMPVRGGRPPDLIGEYGKRRPWALDMAKSCLFYVVITICVWAIITIIAFAIGFIASAFGY